MSAPRAAAAAPTTNDSRCDASPSVISAAQAVLEDRHLALAQPRDPVGVDVGAHHLVTEVRQARGSGEADVPGPDDGDAHAARPPALDHARVRRDCARCLRSTWPSTISRHDG